MINSERAYGKADLHIHTSLGDGMADLPGLLEYVEHQTDLDIIAVTDHDQLEAGLRARELHARHGSYRFQVLPGNEITTIGGHLLALGIEEPIPSFRSLAATIDAVHRQGGLCLIPHPMSWLTRSIGLHGIERILAHHSDGLWFDGFELSNQSPAGRVVAARVQRLNAESFHLPEAGGSDAHYLQTVGTSFTAFPGRTLSDLRDALTAGATRSTRGPAPTLAQIGYGQVARQTWRGLWATPRRIARTPALRLASLYRRQTLVKGPSESHR